MPALGKTTLVEPVFVGMTLVEFELTAGTSSFAFLAAENLAGSLLAIIAALAMRLEETEFALLTDAGTALPNTLPSRTFRNTWFELTIMPKARALLARF